MIKKFTLRLMVLAVLATSLSLTTSCKKDDEDATTPSTTIPDCLPIKETDSNGDSYIYTYDSQRRLVKQSDEDDTDGDYTQYEYDSNNRVSKVLNYEGNELEGTSAIEYNSQGKWSKVTYTEPGETETDISTAEYDSNGNRIKIVNGLYTQTFEYINGNLTKNVETEKNSSGVVTYTSTDTYEYYIDKDNKLAALLEFYNLGYDGTPSKNMLKKRSNISGSSTTPSVTNYTYEYNEKGFPTKETSTNQSYDRNGDGKIDASDTYTYSSSLTYQCK